MLDALIAWYVAHARQMLVGQCLFFLVLSAWAWRQRGRTHFFTEIGLYAVAVLAFATWQMWAFALLSLVIWAHIALIVREIFMGGDE